MTNSINLTPIGRYDSGIFDDSAAEIVAYDPSSQRLFVVNGANKAIDILDVSDPTNPEFSFDTSDILGLDACNIGPQLCGPPLAEFFGVSGTGALGNLIISIAGEVIGIDMISFGVGYDKERTYGNVFDNCGKGRGAVIRPIVEDYTDENGN